MILQIISDASTANWVIAVVLSVLSILVYRLLNRIENKLENHEERIQGVETDVEVLKVIHRK